LCIDSCWILIGPFARVDTASKFLEPLSAATCAVHERAPQRRASSPQTFLTFLPTAVRPDAPTLVDAVSRADFHRRLVSRLAIPCAAHLRLVRSHASSSGPRRTPKKRPNHSRRHTTRTPRLQRCSLLCTPPSALPTTRTGLISSPPGVSRPQPPLRLVTAADAANAMPMRLATRSRRHVDAQAHETRPYQELFVAVRRSP
jgi:hypothetical protein